MYTVHIRRTSDASNATLVARRLAKTEAILSRIYLVHINISMIYTWNLELNLVCIPPVEVLLNRETPTYCTYLYYIYQLYQVMVGAKPRGHPLC